jgi:hypothetical protein
MAIKLILDRTSFAAMNSMEADREMHNYKDLSLREIFEIVNYLNSVAYNYPVNNPPKMDKNFSGVRSLKNG